MLISLLEAQQLLVDLGHRPITHLGSGMEGHVFDIGMERVAKVWSSKKPDEVIQLQSFYESVRDVDLPFATPLITNVHNSPVGVVSIERALQGTPLNDVVFRDEKVPPRFAADAVISVLTALRTHPVQDPVGVPPLLGVVPSNESRSNGPVSVLLEVARHKVERYGDQLRCAVCGVRL